jgi:hypothetical protein
MRFFTKALGAQFCLSSDMTRDSEAAGLLHLQPQELEVWEGDVALGIGVMGQVQAGDIAAIGQPPTLVRDFSFLGTHEAIDMPAY